MKKKGLFAQLGSGLLLAAATLSLVACGNIIYREPAYNYAGRPIPPSGLLQRVLVSYTSNGSSGGLEMLDGLRDLRMNVQDTIPGYFIKGYSGGLPTQIISFPEQLRGYVFDTSSGSLTSINYGTETSIGSVASFGSGAPSAAANPDGTIFVGAIPGSGVIQVVAPGRGTFSLNLPNVEKVVINQGGSVMLAMVRNSNSLYRVVSLPSVSNPVLPPGYVDCEPLLLPQFCVVPVKGTFDRPTNAYFSLDGTTAYVLNCGPECGGTTASVSFLQESSLLINLVPTVDPLLPTSPTSMVTLPVANPVPVPGGVTAALSDGSTLYLAGQQLLSNGLFSGNLSLLNLTTYIVNPVTYPISDGSHSKMLFADDNTLWIGSQQCANGERAFLAASGDKTQNANTNCLTRFALGTPVMTCPTAQAATNNPYTPVPLWIPNYTYSVGSEICEGTTLHIVQTAGVSGSSAPSWNTAVAGITSDGSAKWATLGPVTQAQIVPGVTPNSTAATILYPNTNQSAYYYGSLTGICWVQQYHKVYTAYGGQIHAFFTSDTTEVNNQYITVQGTVLDVAYMDALTNSAN